jgi:hypothetical protein
VKPKIYIGIDVSKDKLDIAVRAEETGGAVSPRSGLRRRGPRSEVRGHIEKLLASVDGEIAELDAKPSEALQATPEDAAKAALVQTVPGVRPVTAATLVGELSELASMTLKPGLLSPIAPNAIDVVRRCAMRCCAVVRQDTTQPDVGVPVRTHGPPPGAYLPIVCIHLPRGGVATTILACTPYIAASPR